MIEIGGCLGRRVSRFNTPYKLCISVKKMMIKIKIY